MAFDSNADSSGRPLSTDRAIARTTAILVVIGVAGNVLSLGKEVLVARAFGISAGMDAFHAALSVPVYLQNVITLTFVNIFIPFFIHLRAIDSRRCTRVAAVAMNYLCLALLLLAFVLYAAAPIVVRGVFRGLAPETAAIALPILRGLAVTVLLGGLISLMTGILNARHRFALAAASSSCITLATVALILTRTAKDGISVLVLGLVIGMVVQLVLLSSGLHAAGYRHSLDFSWHYPELRRLFTSASVFSVAILLSQLNPIVDRVIAAFLPAGSVAALGFVEKLTSVPLVVFSSSLATVAFPSFAEQTGAGRFEELKATLGKTIRLAAVVLIPLSAACVAFAHPVVRLLFQRGNFSAASTDLTATTFACSSLQFFFYTTNLLLVRAALALGEGLLLVKLTIVAVAVNTLSNIALVLLLRPPVAGIALSTSLMAFLNALLLFLALRRRIGGIGGRRILEGMFRIGMVTLPVTVGAWSAYRLLEHHVADGPWFLQAAALGACMTTLMVAVLLLSWRAGIEEVRSLWTAIFSRTRTS